MGSLYIDKIYFLNNNIDRNDNDDTSMQNGDFSFATVSESAFCRAVFYFCKKKVMDYILLILAIVAAIIGIVGCLVPVIPGPPLSFVSLLLLQFTRWGDFGAPFLWIMALLAVAVTVLDYIVPSIGTKKFGGTKRGSWGATIGLFVGMFFGPISIVLFPFIGAFIGEYTGNVATDQALRSALGSFIGILAGVIVKMVASGLMLYYFIEELIK